MSIYDDIKNAAGEGPAYPKREDYTTVYGYASGKVLGTFANAADAKTAGATTTEKNFDTDGFNAAKKAYNDHATAIGTKWYDTVRAEYPNVSDKLFAHVHSEAYDRSHSYGYGEVEGSIDTLMDFALKAIEIGG